MTPPPPPRRHRPERLYHYPGAALTVGADAELPDAGEPVAIRQSGRCPASVANAVAHGRIDPNVVDEAGPVKGEAGVQAR